MKQITKIQNFLITLPMRYEIKDDRLKTLLETGSGSGEYKTLAKDAKFMSGLKRVFAAIESAPDVNTLFQLSFLHYERLKGNLSGLSSARITNASPYRLIIEEHESGLSISILRMEDYHDGK